MRVSAFGEIEVCKLSGFCLKAGFVGRSTCDGTYPMDGTYQMANMLSTGFQGDRYQKLYVVRLMMEVLPKTMIKKLPTGMSQTVIQMIKGQFKFDSANHCV